MLNTSLATMGAESAIKTNNAITGKIVETNNKRNESISRYKNTCKGMQKDTFVTSVGAGATIATTAAVANSKKAQKVLSQSFKPIKKAFCDSKFGKEVINTCKGLADEAKPLIESGAKWVKNLPKPAKAILGIGTAVTAIASGIVHAQTRKKDEQIIREYTKKEAMIQQQFK
ncbi:MAG: hypothetical protein IKU37_00905 [Candidatus Gastranaerophilales bacterium]|nr:hypothetical protein [Candidatus Gastranaerophilales bacterium]